VKSRFIADPAVEYIGYCDEQPAGTVFMGRVSAYLNRAKGKVLLICTNDGGYGRSPERYAAEKQWGYHVKLDLARRGLIQRKRDADRGTRADRGPSPSGVSEGRQSVIRPGE
jgi:hypothetical protein